MRPIIGLTTDEYFLESQRNDVSTEHVRVIEKVGGVPLVIPFLAGEETVDGAFQVLDGLLITGGPDPDPVYWGEGPHPGIGRISPERDFTELALIRRALKAGLPVMGICRGVQMLNVAAGGTIVQDIPSQLRGALKHHQNAPRWYGTHEVKLREGTRLAAIFGVDTLRVNSYHHQALGRVAPGLAISAEAPDGVIEGIEATNHPFAVGMQFHPEMMWERDPRFELPFRALVEAAAARLGQTGRGQARPRG